MDIVERRDAFLSALTARAEADPRLQAVWLEGSLGRGNADRYSDVDVHILLSEGEIPDWQNWLSELAPLVLFDQRFGGAMVNALTADGLRIDLWPHKGESIALERERVKVLYAELGAVELTDAATPLNAASLAERALAVIREFWRCISLLPSVIGRQENLVALQGLTVELGLVTELLMLGEGVVRDRGVKNLNAYLPEEMRELLERCVLPHSLTPAELAAAHLRLAELVQTHGPLAAQKLGFVYPQELEDAVMKYVHVELNALHESKR